ncbi:MAG TPA: hypothetical protein VFG83_01265 [Kofleriaceae bacterium]|nr:hypothetical protein [Kofleriaceae bacterium]
MEDLLNSLVEKVGIDPDTAAKVMDFLKEHADEVIKHLGGVGDLAEKVPGLGGLFD